jgi:hypothetical protein
MTKAKITWGILLLMAIGLAGSSKNFCGKNCPCAAAAMPAGMESMGEAAVSNLPAGEDTGSETLGISPVNLFIFQLK